MYDVAIIGAGPAGATAARLLSARYRVLLVDRRAADSDTPKLCGGLLATAAQRELARQGLGVPSEVLQGPQLFAVRALDRAAGLERLYQRHYTNVDRGAFDRWLCDLVPSRVDRREGWALTELTKGVDGVMLGFETPGGSKASALARLVVGADGANSTVRRLAFADAGAPAYRAIQATYDAGGSEAHYGAFFDSALTDYYGWTVPKGDKLIVGLAVPAGTQAIARFEAFATALRREGVAHGAELARASAPILRPARPYHLRLGAGRIALLGEAAGLISPSSAEGISYALRTGAILAEAAASGLEGAVTRYRDAALPVALEVVGKMAKARVIHGAAVRRAVMWSGVSALRTDRVAGLGGAVVELLTP
jgi:flavin-dependent dehydrogenase